MPRKVMQPGIRRKKVARADEIAAVDAHLDTRRRGSTMTRMLASVTGPQEAEIALAGGSDIIDVTDPAAGPWGSVNAAAVRATVQAVGGRRPVSAVAGDLPMQASHLKAAVRALAATGVETVKLSISSGGNIAACIDALA